MAYIFNRNTINSTILSIVLSSFILTYAVPIHAQNYGIGLNEAAFIYRVEKLRERIWKLKKTDNKDKMYDTIIDLKTELEGS